MMNLIYEKSSLTKIKILRTIMEYGGRIENTKLLSEIRVSSTTLNKYLMELCMELPSGGIIFDKDDIYIDNKKCALYDMQIMYFSKSIVKDLLHQCFFSKKMTFEQMAQKLYISSSKLFKVIDFINHRFKKFDIQIVKKTYISIYGPPESILIIYNLLLQVEEEPFEVSFNKLDKEKLRTDIMFLLKKYNIQIDSNIVRELSLWLITINDRFYLYRFCSSSMNSLFPQKFIDEESNLVKDLQNIFLSYDRNTFNYEGCVLIIIFLLYNSIGIHFKLTQAEFAFFDENLKVNYLYFDVIFAILTKKEYRINPKNINLVTLKIEGAFQFRNILCPYFQIYEEFFNPKMRSSSNFISIEKNLKKDLNLFMEKHFSTVNIDTMCMLLAHVISFFQEKYFNKGNYFVGVYSSKGSLFELQLCEELHDYIQIIPYEKFEDKKLNLLLIDDLRLLNNTSIKYDEYYLLGDYL